MTNWNSYLWDEWRKYLTYHLISNFIFDNDTPDDLFNNPLSDFEVFLITKGYRIIEYNTLRDKYDFRKYGHVNNVIVKKQDGILWYSLNETNYYPVPFDDFKEILTNESIY